MVPETDSFHAALAHHKAGRLSEAAAMYQAVLHENPYHTDALFNLATLMTSIGEYQAASTMYEQVLTLIPEDPNTLSNLGNLMHAQNRNQEAESYYLRAIQIDPGLPAPHVNLGNVRLNAGRYQEAADAFEQALIINPDFGQAHNNMGAALHALGRVDEARRHLSRALQLDPNSADAHNNIGNLFMREGDVEDAAQHFQEACRLKPDWAQAHFNLGAALEKAGEAAEAEAAYRDAIRLKTGYVQAMRALASILIDREERQEAEEVLKNCRMVEPDSAETEFLIGSLYNSQGNFTEALQCFERALALCDTVPEIHNNLGIVLQKLGRHEEAVTVFEQALELNPKFSQARNNVGHSLMELDRADEAIASFRAAIELAPGTAINYANLGIALQSVGRYNDALDQFNTAIEFDPDLPEAYNGRGITLQNQNRHAEAIEAFDKAIELRPKYPEALNNVAISYQEEGLIYKAIEAYHKVIDLNPDHRQVYYNLGSLLQGMARHDEAVGIFYRALKVAPDYNDVYPYLAHSLMQQCSWSNLNALFEKVITNTERELSQGKDVSVSPFALQSIPCSMELRLRVARHMAAKAEKRVEGTKETLPFTYARHRGEKIKIGYVSPDFRYHSVGLAFKGLLQYHDRDRFDIHGYSIATWIGEGDPVAEHFPAAFDHFTDISRMPFRDAAIKINDDGINILVDLTGHTRGQRPDIFALQPAPLQAHYLGFSTTIGADYIQYLITDKQFMPLEMEPYCSESLVYLPETMFAATHPEVSSEPVSRSDCDLPEDAAVFANFNGHYKLHPTTFSIWMRILRRIPDSVLWLMDGTETSRKNLRIEAKNQGIDPSRLIFAPHLPHAQHLARQRLADLVLDHIHHGGGVTTSDALWVGLPVLTVAGDTPPARNGATLLPAIGLPELVTESLTEYERMAIELGRDREKLVAIRAKLEANRETQPLFNTERLTRHLEGGYEAMWENYLAGNEPRTLTVPKISD